MMATSVASTAGIDADGATGAPPQGHVGEVGEIKEIGLGERGEDVDWLRAVVKPACQFRGGLPLHCSSSSPLFPLRLQPPA
jgi:hypothetical protein